MANTAPHGWSFCLGPARKKWLFLQSKASGLSSRFPTVTESSASCQKLRFDKGARWDVISRPCSPLLRCSGWPFDLPMILLHSSCNEAVHRNHYICLSSRWSHCHRIPTSVAGSPVASFLAARTNDLPAPSNSHGHQASSVRKVR